MEVISSLQYSPISNVVTSWWIKERHDSKCEKIMKVMNRLFSLLMTLKTYLDRSNWSSKLACEASLLSVLGKVEGLVQFQNVFIAELCRVLFLESVYCEEKRSLEG